MFAFAVSTILYSLLVRQAYHRTASSLFPLKRDGSCFPLDCWRCHSEDLSGNVPYRTANPVHIPLLFSDFQLTPKNAHWLVDCKALFLNVIISLHYRRAISSESLELLDRFYSSILGVHFIPIISEGTFFVLYINPTLYFALVTAT